MRAQRGQSLTEYVLILLLVGMSTVIALNDLGMGVDDKLRLAVACFDGAASCHMPEKNGGPKKGINANDKLANDGLAP